MLQRTFALEVVRDSSRAKAVIADARFDSGISCPPRNHPVSILLGHAMWRTGKVSRRAKQRPVLVFDDAGRGDIFIEIGFKPGDARRFMFLAAFLVQANSTAPSLYEVVADIHLHDRTDTGECVNHHCDERAIAQAFDRAYINGGEQGARLVAVEYRSAALGNDVPGTAHRMGGIGTDNLADNKPVKEHADCGQELLDSRLCKSALETLDIGGDIQGLHVLKLVIPRSAQNSENLHAALK